ncbi:MAG: hypothetical protein ACTSQG_10700, partial [Promethearchaeota archaeon]
SYNWYSKENNQLGIWFNSYDPGISNVLFDERDYGKISKGEIINLDTGERGVYEKSFFKLKNIDMGFKTIMGFWMNDNLYVGDVNNLENIDYVVSTHKLNLTLIKSKNDIFIYSAKGEE